MYRQVEKSLSKITLLLWPWVWAATWVWAPVLQWGSAVRTRGRGNSWMSRWPPPEHSRCPCRTRSHPARCRSQKNPALNLPPMEPGTSWLSCYTPCSSESETITSENSWLMFSVSGWIFYKWVGKKKTPCVCLYETIKKCGNKSDYFFIIM